MGGFEEGMVVMVGTVPRWVVGNMQIRGRVRAGAP